MKWVFMFFILNLSGCVLMQGPYPKSTLVINETDKMLDINLEFVSAEYGKSSWSTTIAPDHLDHWEYTKDRDYKEILDKRLQTMMITSVDGCSKVFTREQIEDIAVYSEGWQITFDDSMIDC